MKRKPPRLILYIIVIFLLAVAIFGCYTENKAKQQFNKAVISYPKIPLDYCAAQFPDKPDSVIITNVDTITEVVFMDSLVSDSVLVYDTFAHTSYIRKIPTKVITKTVVRDNIIYRENRAEQERLQLALLEANKNVADLIAKNTVLEKDRNEWKVKARKRSWEFWGLIFLVIGAIGTRIYLKSKSILK